MGTSAGASRARSTMARSRTEPLGFLAREGPAYSAGPRSFSCFLWCFCVLRCPWTQPAGPGLRRSGCGGHLVGRPAHAPARTRPQTYAGPHATLTALERHRNPLGDATSTRRIGLLGRACRLHRHAPFQSGQRRVLRLPLAATSIHPTLRRVNPTRTGHSRRSWWGVRPSRKLHIAVICPHPPSPMEELTRSPTLTS